MYSSLSELGLTILHQFLNASAAIFRKAHKSGNSSLTTSAFILIVIRRSEQLCKHRSLNSAYIYQRTCWKLKMFCKHCLGTLWVGCWFLASVWWTTHQLVCSLCNKQEKLENKIHQEVLVCFWLCHFLQSDHRCVSCGSLQLWLILLWFYLLINLQRNWLFWTVISISGFLVFFSFLC